MKRQLISAAGTVVALGFLGASAVANYVFGASLARTSSDAVIYGGVGVLAVAMNALAPFFISWSLAASRRSTTVGIMFMWALCLAYSFTSALGFAAQNRERTVISQQVGRDAYDDTRRELLDLEARARVAQPRERPRLEARIDEVRRRLDGVRAVGATPVDAQASFLSSIVFGLIDARQVRVALVALFAVMVEVCATLGLFAALSHTPPLAPSQVPSRAERNVRPLGASAPKVW